MSSRDRWSQWVASVVVAGLVAMHGATSNHGTGLMSTSPTLTMPAPNPTVRGAAPMEPTTQPSTTVAVHGMGVHAMTLCVALPVTFLLLAALVVGYRSRRRHGASSPRWGQLLREARAPPCPPSHVREVCLT